MIETNQQPPIDLPIFRRYWVAYGGLSEQLRSGYLYFALALTAILHPYWLSESWWDTALTVLPNLLGFSIGGFVMWLGFGSSAIKMALHTRKSKNGVSIYLGVSAVFAHFVLIQAVALIMAVVAKATQFPVWQSGTFQRLFAAFGVGQPALVDFAAPVGYGVGFFFFVYSITLVIEAALAVFRVASWHDYRH